jgi:uncharacterized delta-60 repeat protein
MRERAASGLAVAALGLGLFAAVAIAAPGDLDPSFDGDGIATIDWNGDDVARSLAIQPDGKIVVVGTGFAAPADIGLSRLNTDGTLDSGFNGNGKLAYALGGVEEGHGLAFQEDGKIVAVGSTDQSLRAAVTRTNSNGTPDGGWGVAGVLTLEYGGDDVARDVVIQPDQKIVTAGYGGATNDIMVTRLTTGATPDPTFNAGAGTRVIDFGGTDYGFGIARQADGKIVVSGYTDAGTSHLALARLTTDGTPDSSFDDDGTKTLGSSFGDIGRDVLVQPDGKILVLSYANNDFKLTRLTSNGGIDSGFAGGGTATIDFGPSDIAQSVALLANGKILVSGQTGGSRAAVALLQPGGSLDTTFSGDGKVILPESVGNAAGIAVQSNGRLVVAGPAEISTGTIAVARLEGESASTGPGDGGQGGPGGQGGGQSVPRCAGKRATIVGTGRSERLKGTRRNDVIVALGGNDKIAAGRGNDIICAGSGNDTVSGDSGKDRLFGQSGKDRLSGGDANDTIDGGSANDKITGGPGKDRLIGGSGKDNLGGGGGRDSCNGGGGRDTASCEKSKAI